MSNKLDNQDGPLLGQAYVAAVAVNPSKEAPKITGGSSGAPILQRMDDDIDYSKPAAKPSTPGL